MILKDNVQYPAKNSEVYGEIIYLEDTLHVKGDSREPIIALFGGASNSIRVGNGGVGNRIEDALGSAKQFPNHALHGIRAGEESGVEPESGHGEGAPKRRFVTRETVVVEVVIRPREEEERVWGCGPGREGS